MDNNLTIMYSSGLDSFIAYNYALKVGYCPKCIWVDLGHPYATKEKDSMMIKKSINPDITIIDMKTLYPLIEHRLKNQIIPSRNLLLATIGSMFSDRVWINSLDGEQYGKEHDKSERFFEDSTSLLSFLNEFFQEKTIIESPFSLVSKTEIITWALNNGISEEDLLSTTSCYSDKMQKCGNCLTCFKRWSAFYANGIEESGYNIHPLHGQYFQELIREIPKARDEKNYSRFSEKRINEFYQLLEIIKYKLLLR